MFRLPRASTRSIARILVEAFNSLKSKKVHRYAEEAGRQNADATAPRQPHGVGQVYLRRREGRGSTETHLCRFRQGRPMTRLSGKLGMTELLRLSGVVMKEGVVKVEISATATTRHRWFTRVHTMEGIRRFPP